MAFRSKTLLLSVSALALMIAPVAAQTDTTDEAAQTMEQAGESTENAAQATADAAGDAAEEVADTADDAADSAGEAAEDVAATANDAGEETADAAGDAAEEVAETADDAADSASTEMAAASDGASEGMTLEALPSEAYLATTLMDRSVLNTAGETVGDVNDLILSKGGEIDAVVIGVGGFIGIGEKSVAVNFGELSMESDDDGRMNLILDTTEEELRAAPDFVADGESATTN